MSTPSPIGAISWLIVDCVDPERLASFWSAVLGVDVAGRRGPYVFLSPRSPSEVRLAFQRTTDGRRGKNRLHPDIATADVVGLARRVVELGGRRAEGYEAGGFLVMADPEGNEFCIVPASQFSIDDDGIASYLDGLDL